MIGEVRDIDLEAAKEGNGRYILVKVVINVNDPLMRCLQVDLMGTWKITTTLLRYERLLDNCFKCSWLGHSMRDCTEAGLLNEATSEVNLRLNVWLRTKLSGEELFSGTMIRSGKIQKDSCEENDILGVHDFQMLDNPSDLSQPLNLKVTVGPPLTIGSVHDGPPVGNNVTDLLDHEKTSKTNISGPNPNNPTSKNIKPTKWKRSAREKVDDRKKKRVEVLPDRDNSKEIITASDSPFLDVGTNAIVLPVVPERNCKDGSAVTNASNVQKGKRVVDSVGKSGGLCLMWDNSIIVDLLSYSPGHIDVRIQDEGNRVWRFTGFYGNPVQAQRLNSWTLLRRLAGLYNMPWVVLGDFNEIMCDSENVGGSNKNWRDMARFREAVDDSNLEDMGFVGAKFTWSNKRDGIAVISERLDISLCNKSVVRHLDFWNSDHRPLVLECADKPINDNSGRSKPGRGFFFEECWGEDIECKRIIEGIWNPPSAQENCLNDVLGKTKACGGKLDIWNRNKRNEMRRNIKDKSLALSVANSANNVSWKQITVLKEKLNLDLDVEERYWRQRAKSDWLQRGDKNSRFFHSKASARRTRNKISRLLDDNGHWKESNADMVQSPTSVTDFRPISLCNVLYKIIAKVISNRFRSVLGSVISETQRAFVHGRLISNNTIAFLRGMMHKLGFSKKWVNLVMNCVSSVTYSFKLNGEVIENIIPSRGLRQGGPAVSLLILICTEGLSSLIREALASNSKVLETYSIASGQLVNYGKLVVCFSASISAREGDRLAAIMGVNRVECHEKYLGLPCFSSRYKQKIFMDIMDRVWGRIKGWGEKLLYVEGKEILVKAVVQSIPTYAMSLFKLSKSLIVEIQRLTARFCDTEAILNIPLGSGTRDDTVICHFEGNEVYSVKSDYWYARRDWLPKNVSVCRNYANFYELIADIATKVDNEALRLFCIICWRSWFLRNTLLHKNGSHMVGIGVVIRDSTGSVMAFYCQFLEANFDSFVVGIMAIFRGILFSQDCGLNSCVLESDKGVAVERILNNNFMNASYGSILSDIAILRIQAKVSIVRAICPCANRVAQRLAKLALEMKTNTFWMEDIPFCIRSIVEADMPP
ncbi:hypothetical protein Ddye_004145 [Dipteronia dyeriana]|uniref:CCHC-type domain-containing protein n=1 Tax=Dipteronia dyeriana TaxID=168575 RepID=A0AAD9XU86_9ROSI|nr:hypothetical protein Ddye_004145 [Dipteronia dyeriana]